MPKRTATAFLVFLGAAGAQDRDRRDRDYDWYHQDRDDRYRDDRWRTRLFWQVREDLEHVQAFLLAAINRGCSA